MLRPSRKHVGEQQQSSGSLAVPSGGGGHRAAAHRGHGGKSSSSSLRSAVVLGAALAAVALVGWTAVAGWGNIERASLPIILGQPGEGGGGGGNGGEKNNGPKPKRRPIDERRGGSNGGRPGARDKKAVSGRGRIIDDGGGGAGGRTLNDGNVVQRHSIEQDGAGLTVTKNDDPVAALKLNAAENKPRPNSTPEFDKDGKTRLHLVFSTDCSAFQHWQSYLLFYTALRVGQPGRVTRIASGCKDEERESTVAWHEEHVRSKMSDRFGLHLTPHFSSVVDADGKETRKQYKFFNKPFGLKHWMEHGEGMGVDPTTGRLLDEDVVVILTDPDMLLLRPIGIDYGSKTNDLLVSDGDRGAKVRVEHGSPFAQKYGLGVQWRTFNLTNIVGEEDTPAKAVDNREARMHYPVGPPYVATGRDMYSIAVKWAEFVPRVHAEYPNLLAEMYAFCIAAAHLQLPFQLVTSLMVSVNGKTEGWPLADAIPAGEVCDFVANPDPAKYPIPNVIHYCQRYTVGEDWFFGKRKMPTSFFTCESPLMAVPPSDLGVRYDYKVPPGGGPDAAEKNRKGLNPLEAAREAFFVCGPIHALNEAGEFYKMNHCEGVGGTRTDKSLKLVDLF